MSKILKMFAFKTIVGFSFLLALPSTNFNAINMINSNNLAINNFGNQLNNNITSLKEEVKKRTKNKIATKEDYLAIIKFLKERNSFNDNIILGSIYAYGIWGKNKKVLISADPNKAYYYFLKSYKQGYDKALLYLVGVLLNNELMHEKIDPTYKLAYKYISMYLKKHPTDPNGLFWKVMIDARINKFNEMVNILMKLATKYHNSDAQLTLALIFLNGLYSNHGVIVDSNIDTANYFLNMACTNQNKSQKVKMFCSNSNIVEKEQKIKSNSNTTNVKEDIDSSDLPECLR